MHFINNREICYFIDTYVKADGGTLQFEQLAKEQKADSDVNCVHMAEVILAIHEYFAENTQEKIEMFFGFFRTNTKIIYISSTELEDAFHLFNVMNNRGIKLRNISEELRRRSSLIMLVSQ